VQRASCELSQPIEAVFLRSFVCAHGSAKDNHQWRAPLRTYLESVLDSALFPFFLYLMSAFRNSAHWRRSPWLMELQTQSAYYGGICTRLC
jgi:hypothetical protein